MKVRVGADPEIFLSRGGTFVSAHDLLPGDKYDPYAVQCGAIQVDGMAAEFNIDPAESEEDFLKNLDIVQQQLKDMLVGVDFMQEASVVFSKDFAKHIPIHNLVLGCEPDFNAYTGEVNPKPRASKLMRTAGGHVHIGAQEFETENPWETNHYHDMMRLMRAMDETVGVYSVLWDKDDQRRSMYGMAGAFRPKTYGGEYRSLSNAWIFNVERCKFVYRGVQKAIEKFLDHSWEPSPLIPLIINNSLRDHDFFKGDETADFVKEVLA